MFKSLKNKKKNGVKKMKIAILTNGGDCQALNAAIRGVGKALFEQIPDVEIFGVEGGFKGLMYEKLHKMEKTDFSGILNQGGTILGTSRLPFKEIDIPDENGVEKISAMISAYKKFELDCLVVLGGNGSHKTAFRLSQKGLNVITLPKTIDNDIYGTDETFGFMSAVDVATSTIDNIHTTASSHSRVFVIEIMGHKAGWLTLYSGIAGGADIILLPEIPYDENVVAEKILMREKEGKPFTIIAVAEGAKCKCDIELSKADYKAKMGDFSISFHLASQIRMLTGKEVRIAIPGHTQRGGNPCPCDRILATRLGEKAAEYIIQENYGVMIASKNKELVAVPLSEVAGKLKTVPADSSIIEAAKKTGICFGE